MFRRFSKTGQPRRRLSVPSACERLEPRQLLSKPAPMVKYSEANLFYNDIEASASGGTGLANDMLIIRNAGTQPLVFTHTGLAITGPNADEFEFTGKQGGATIQPGQTRSIKIGFNATALGVQTATLVAKSNDPKHPKVDIQLRGLGTAGTGGDLEPSLQNILNLYGIPDNVGEPDPSQTAFPIPPATPNDEVVMQTMVAANASSPVSISLLAVFDNFKSPATTVGWYPQGNGSATNDLFSVPEADAQSVNPQLNGATSFNAGSTEFGIYTVFPAFSNRHSYSQDALNTWEPVVANRKKVRFYPLKNSDGSVVPNAYVFATEDYNVTYDFNDVVGVIRNVKPGPNATNTTSSTPPPGSTGSSTGSIGNISGLSVLNLAGAPSNDRVVFNRITNLDTVRPNVTDNISSVKITNTSSSSMTIDSISLLDNVDFNINSGGGSNITLGAGQSRTITLEFNGAGSGSTILKTFQTNLQVKSGGKTDTIVLAGLWQAYSEQTPADPSHLYDEASLSTIVNTIFGYKTDIANSGQTKTQGLLVMLGTHGDSIPVGSEVTSAYWTAANSADPVTVRMLAAFHRQNNFDPTTGDPETAASTVRYFYDGTPSSAFKLFQHNINEGQSLLPHNSGSTTAYAEASFTPTPGKTFGFKVDSNYSDDSLNNPDFNPSTKVDYPDSGHSFRFYPLVDENGNTVPNTYIMAMDYTGLSYSNYDYQDNIYIVSNISPATLGSSRSSSSNATSALSPSDLFSSTSVSSSSTSGDSPDVLDRSGGVLTL